MAHYLFTGLYAADKQDDLTNWEGALLSLGSGRWTQPHILALPLAQQKTIASPDIRQAAAFIHAQRQAERPVLIFCPTGVPRAAVFALAYLIEYGGMSLPDAYVLISNFAPLVPPPHDWVYALVECYELDHPRAMIFDDLLPAQMALACARAIHAIDQGIHISNIEALQNPARALEQGIEAILRVDNHDRQQGQWPPTFDLCDLPLRDGHTVTRAQITTATGFIHRQVQADRRVLVHCQEGISRSVTMVLAYLIEYAGMTLVEAARLVVHKRPVAAPHPALLASLVEAYTLPFTAEQVYDWNFFHRLTLQ